MSKETLTHLNRNTLIGMTDKRGTAWHYRADEQGAESNHYEGAIPIEDVRRRLFKWEAVEGRITATALTFDGVITTVDPDRKAIMRGDTGDILGIFKLGYKIHQYNDWLISNVETILDADLKIGSAGLLKNGAVGWVQIEMEETLSVCGAEFRPFLLAATSLDGSLATTYQTGAQLVVCDNSLSAALASKENRIKIRHSAHSLGRIGDARDALGIIYEVADAFTAQVEKLTAETVTDKRWNAFVDAYSQETDSVRGRTLAETKAAELNRLYRTDLRVQPWAGTAFGVLQAVNTFVHHSQTVRGVSRTDRNMERTVTGAVDKLDAGTLALLATV
jgi:phage/plasmid-like protein (TIGR03299 family)